MFDYQQRETTPAYRDGWDMIWGKEEKGEEERGDVSDDLERETA